MEGSVVIMFRILILLCICCYACSDEGIRITFQQVSESSVTTGVPIEVQELLWEDPVYLKERLLQVQQDETQPDWVEDTIKTNICIAEKQRLYYTKYIDAGGIAIMGNSHVTDEEFLFARDAILRMTAKRPEMRKLMSPAARFTVILIPEGYSERISEIPRFTCRDSQLPTNYAGVGTRFYSLARVRGLERTTVIHEFAHSMHAFINRYEQKYSDCYYASGVTLETLDFQNRLEVAYQRAVELGTWPVSTAPNIHEYWVTGVFAWYYDIGEGRRFPTRADFAAHDPLLEELVSEWFLEDSFFKPYQFSVLR